MVFVCRLFWMLKCIELLWYWQAMGVSLNHIRKASGGMD
jgi:hypothetical protein